MCFFTSQFLKRNNNIFFTRADKRNITVAIDRDTYVDKMNSLLSDYDTYISNTKNPLNNIENNLKSILNR